MSLNGNIQVAIDGDVHGQVAVGNNIIQIGDVNGGHVYVAPPREEPNYTRRKDPSNLRPRPFPSLLDREDETATVKSALQASTPVSLFGPGGIGKTSLLRSLAHSSEMDVFTGGVVYIRTAGLGLEDVLQSLFNAFHESQAHYKPTDSEMRIALQGINALILLDDLSLTRDESMSLLDALPGCTVVLAGKERNLWGEGRIVSLEGLPVEDALGLFERELSRSLNEREQDEVREICALLGGHPLRILQSASLAREESLPVSNIKAQIQQDAPDEAILTTSLKSSTDKQKSLVAILAAAGGVGVPVDHLRSLSGSDTVSRDIQGLVSRGLVQAEGSKFNLVGELAGAVSNLWDLTPWENKLIVFLADWLVKKPAKKLLDESIDVLLQSIQKAGEKHRWSDVVRIGRGLERSLVLLRRWHSWMDILNLILKAARALGDRKIEAWALHQLGTRAGCLGFSESAREFLTQALQIRQAIGDQAGLAITQNNMHVFFKTPLPSKPVKTQSGYRRWMTYGAIGVVGVVALIGAVVVGALVLPALRPEPVPLPTEVTVIPVSETPLPSATNTEFPTVTPTYTDNPTITITLSYTPTATITPSRTKIPTRTFTSPPPTTISPPISVTPPQDNTPPPVPSIDRPKNDYNFSCPSPGSIIFEWNKPSDPSGITRYVIRLQGSVEKGGPWSNISTYSVPGVLTKSNATSRVNPCNTFFYFRWRIRAEDGAGNIGSWSTWQYFQATFPSVE